jgi:hypothetical protein
VTHQVTVDGSVVTKTYRSASRGEALREWTALCAISALAADLVPTPLSISPGPSVSMTTVPGVPLDGALTPSELGALEVTLRHLWSLPTEGLLPTPLPEFVERVRAEVPAYSGEGLVSDAHAAAASWLASPDIEALLEPASPVIGHGDPNLSNYLWDGVTVRIVDFEDCGASDLALELANLVEHLSARETDWRRFLSGFTVDAGRLLAARRLYAIFWLTLVRPGGPSFQRNPPSTFTRQADRVLKLLDAN